MVYESVSWEGVEKGRKKGVRIDRHVLSDRDHQESEPAKKTVKEENARV